MWNTRSVVRSSWLVAVMVSAIGVAVAIAIATSWAHPDTKRIDARSSVGPYWYAMYKLGSLDFDLRRFHEAGEKFSLVAHGTKDDEELVGLHHVSTNDFVRAYAELGETDAAYPVFQEVDPDRALDMLETLADHYLSERKTGPAIDVYQELIKAAPTHDHVCLWQYNVAHAYVVMVRGNNSETVIQIEHLVLLSSALHRKSSLPRVEAKECHDNAAAMAGNLARAYHSEAAKTKSAETLGYAERLYTVYLEAFPDAEDFAQTQYYYAELLWARAETETRPRLKTERWANAASAFTAVVKTGKVEAKLMRESAYAAVLGWRIAINAEPSVTPTNDNAPMPDNGRKLIAAVQAYASLLHDPNDNDVVGAKLVEAVSKRRSRCSRTFSLVTPKTRPPNTLQVFWSTSSRGSGALTSCTLSSTPWSRPSQCSKESRKRGWSGCATRACRCDERSPRGVDVDAGPVPQLVANLSQQVVIGLACLRRRDHTVDRLDDEEEHRADEQQVDRRGQDAAVLDGRTVEIEGQRVEVVLANDRGDEGHHHAFGERDDDGTERDGQNDADRELERISLDDEVAKFLEHDDLRWRAISRIVPAGATTRDRCKVVRRQNTPWGKAIRRTPYPRDRSPCGARCALARRSRGTMVDQVHVNET